ncbi:MAG: protein TolQ [Alphaproteobacteria bacterium]|nr:protein TolQ [Alphaproteobacteria bacterium]
MQGETVRTSLSMYGMFMDSDIFMKALIIGLLVASVCCWAIIFDKVFLFKRLRQGMKAFEEQFWSGGSLETIYNNNVQNPSNPLALIFVTAIKEFRRSLVENKKAGTSIKIQERIDKVMQIAIDRQVDKLETRMVFLASTGSVAPLLGLFGTVWGIMDSFNAIGLTQSTNIAAVAPGVAEALFTTAVGLIAAIPAVIAYNKLSNDIDRISHRMETFSDELSAILSRQIDQVEG